jgi:hypothetical protein
MYRSSWLLVTLPLLIALLSVAHTPALSAPGLAPTFDPRAAHAFAEQLAKLYPDRTPGSPGALGAAQWFSDQMKLYGYETEEDPFTATVPGVGRVPLTNLTVTVQGRTQSKALVVMAHRDDAGTGPGANDNASGTGALIELVATYAKPPTSTAPPVQPTQTIVFLSTDGGIYGGLGAAHFAHSAAYRNNIAAAINLDAVAGNGKPRLEIAGDKPRTPAGRLVETAAARIFDQTRAAPGRTSVLGQLIDLGFPFSLYEQAPFVGRGVPAITLTTSGDRPRQSFSDTEKQLNATRLGQIGRASQSILGSLEQSAGVVQGTSSYLYVGTRHVRGWAIELVLISMLVPFLAAAVDLFARCRRRGIALRPAFRAYRARLLFWLFLGAVFELFALAGIWPQGAARPLDPASSAAGDWPVLGLLGLAAVGGMAWYVARGPLVARRPATAEEDLAGHAAALLGLGLIGLLVVATNPFALLFLLPSLHAWLWLPQVRGGALGARLLVLLAGFAGPLLLLGSFATRFGLGLDAPWYVTELVAVGYVGLTPFAFALAWAAAAAQLAVLAVGRYAPYPSRREQPRGPLRELVRRTVLTILRIRAQRRVVRNEERALEA